MGVWGFGPLDNDNALDFVEELIAIQPAERCPVLMSAMERALESDPLDIDEAAPAYLAALTVALARDPNTLPDQRERLLEIASVRDHVSSFQDFLGDLKPLRSARTA